MKLVIQRVSRASVSIEGKVFSEIQHGLLVLLGVHESDTAQDVDWLVQKLCLMRIFTDEQGKMNLSVQDVAGSLLVVSQFTLYAATAKGNRPSFIDAAKPDKASLLYDSFCQKASSMIGKPVMKGVFGADMQVSLENDGPVTIVIDSLDKQ